VVIKAASSAQVSRKSITLGPKSARRPPHIRSFRDGWRHLRYAALRSELAFDVAGASLVVFAYSRVRLLSGPRRVSFTLLSTCHTISLE